MRWDPPFLAADLSHAHQMQGPTTPAPAWVSITHTPSFLQELDYSCLCMAGAAGAGDIRCQGGGGRQGGAWGAAGHLAPRRARVQGAAGRQDQGLVLPGPLLPPLRCLCRCCQVVAWLSSVCCACSSHGRRLALMTAPAWDTLAEPLLFFMGASAATAQHSMLSLLLLCISCACLLRCLQLQLCPGHVSNGITA